MMMVMMVMVVIMATSALSVMVMMMFMLFMVVIMAAAAFLIMVMMMFMLFMVVIMAAAALSIMVMMMFMLFMVVIMAAATLLIMVMMLMLFMIMVVVMMVMTALLIMLMMVMYMAALRAYLFFCKKLLFQGYRMLHNFQEFLSIQLLDRCRNDGSFAVDLAQQFHCLSSFLLIYDIGTAHDDRARILNLVVKKLAKVSHIHFAFLRIYYGSVAVEDNVHILLYPLYRFDDIR
jgi:hypothetical protein